MNFSFFTKSSNKISGRLRIIGSAFQLWGATTAAFLLPSYWALTKLVDKLPPEQAARIGPRMLVTGFGFAASLYLIGRALYRRQRWGAYLAILTLAGPRVVSLVTGYQLRASMLDTALNVVGLILIASAWKELHPPAYEVELDDADDDEPGEPLTPRNRGYGEPRTLPRESIVSNPAAESLASLPINRQSEV